MLKEILVSAAKKHAEAEIDLHEANIEVYMQQMATAHDRLEMLNKYF